MEFILNIQCGEEKVSPHGLNIIGFWKCCSVVWMKRNFQIFKWDNQSMDAYWHVIPVSLISKKKGVQIKNEKSPTCCLSLTKSVQISSELPRQQCNSQDWIDFNGINSASSLPIWLSSYEGSENVKLVSQCWSPWYHWL